MAQLMPLPLTVSCFSKIQIGFTFLVPAYLGSPEKRAVKRVCVCVVYETSSSVAAALIDYYFTYVLRGVCGAITERNIAMRRMNSRNASRYCFAALK